MRREPDVRTFISHLPLFHGLSPAELSRIAEGTTRERVPRGKMLFRQGDPATGFHAVVYGRIALVSVLPSGRQRMRDIVGPGRSFGEVVMFLDKPYIVTATALTDSLVVHISKKTVLAELERSPDFARRIIAGLSARLHAAMRELDSYALGSGSRRFAAWLLRLVAEDEEGETLVTLPAPKGAIASKLNVSAEHLSRILGELTREGMIEVRGRRVRIPDARRLREWSEQPEAAAG